MRFSVATVALAGTAYAAYQVEAPEPESTVYATEYYTITSCGPTVTNCPAESTAVYSSSYPLTTSTIYSTNYQTKTESDSTYVVTETIPIGTTVCPVEEGYQTSVYPTSEVYPTGYPSESASAVPYPTGSASGYPSGVPYPTGGYPTGEGYPTGGESSYPTGGEGPYPTETVAPACPTYSVKTISTSVTTVVPTVIYETVEVPCPTASAGYSVPIGNGSYPTATYPAQATVTAGAATMGGSVLLAAAAGLAAILA